MQTVQLRDTVKRDHQLLLVLPPDFPEGDVDITVRSAQTQLLVDSDIAQQQRDDLRSFFEFLNTLPASGRTKAEIDQQIQEERDSWE
ncbi:MAG: hypothetical protein WCH44_14110 [Betaproteobacteria bacterium]